MNILDKEYNFFLKNRDHLVKQYKNKFIVIKNEEVVGTYDTEAEAYVKSIEKYNLGEFLIQKCLPEKEIPPQVFHSRVAFWYETIFGIYY